VPAETARQLRQLAKENYRSTAAELADGTARGEVRGFGNERYLRWYAVRSRELAAEELCGQLGPRFGCRFLFRDPMTA
jgi:hypothetical protein